MKKTAIIWRESVYKNNFKCNRCGTKLADEQNDRINKRFKRLFTSCTLRQRKRYYKPPP